MGWESIGECVGSDSNDPPEWVDFCHETAISYIKVILGDPPCGWELGIQWHDHDLGSFPTISVFTDLPLMEPWDYIHKAEALLGKFNESVSWSEIEPIAVIEDEDLDEDDDEYQESL
jgi:hypothetical protein